MLLYYIVCSVAHAAASGTRLTAARQRTQYVMHTLKKI